MLSDVLQLTFITSLLAGMIRTSTPLLFAALGELVTERSGILNLSVEGTMLVGALAGFLTAYMTGSLWLAVLVAALAGGVLCLLMALMTVSLKIDQTVSGLTLNLFASGITFYIYRVVFNNVASENLPNIKIFELLRIPLLSKIPVLGEALFSQYAMTYLGLLMVPVISWFLYKTKLGLELRCIGENPRAIDMKGLNIKLYQYLALFFGGMMAGIGGSFLTVASAGLFVPDIASGRGWIAIAIVIFGNWKPRNILLASLFFGLLDTFQLQVQGVGLNIPYQFLLALPYVLTIVALVVSRHRGGAPISLGIPYSRE